MIERYYHEQQGYNPFLISDGWQVAQLNYMPGHGLDDMDDVEQHRQTDEVFILFCGTAVLVAAEVGEAGIVRFECEYMIPGMTYNIPAGTWHNIGMSPDAQMIIVERSSTHLNDCLHCPLSAGEIERLRRAVVEALDATSVCEGSQICGREDSTNAAAVRQGEKV